MRKILFFTILVGLSVSGVFAQKRRGPVKPVKSVPTAVRTLAEIPETGWKTLTDALAAEDWNKSAALAVQNLQYLKTENEKKQLARLRYIYLYALAGKILAFNAAGRAAEAEKTWSELDRAMEIFIGQEFVLPARPFSDNCEKKLNFICQVKDDPLALRTTATNKQDSAIHSFDYVLFEEPVDIEPLRENAVFLGGILQKAEYNEDKTKPWVLRLFFKKGFYSVLKSEK